MSAPRKHASSQVSNTKPKKTAKLVVKSKIDELKNLSKDIVRSKKQCNGILQLFELGELIVNVVKPALTQVINQEHESCTHPVVTSLSNYGSAPGSRQASSSEDVILGCIRAYHKVFCHYLDSNDIQHLPDEQNHKDKSEIKIRLWLRERYKRCLELLFAYLKHESSAVKELALCTLMKYVESEGKQPLIPGAKSSTLFPIALFERVVKALLHSDEDEDELIQRFQEYLEYDDVRYHYMRQLQPIIKDMVEIPKESDDSVMLETRLSNLLNGMLVLTLPGGTEKLGNLYVAVKNVPSSISSIKAQRELYSKLWLSFVSKKLTGTVYKKILISLPDKVLPYLSDPLVMSDWLVSCYDHGGAVSLMALNGLFVLMNSYNLEYPDFYNKLYNTMCTEIFSAKYKARFFHLLDLFLRSLLLPTFTIAAFIKKLSRMALHAPPQGAMLSIDLIINLLIRHDTCRTLAHRDTPCDLQSDPYLPEEIEMSKCRAIDSSLWEIKTLQKHWHHSVASQARRLEKPLPQTESLLDDMLELTYDDLMTKEVKKSKKAKQKEASGEITVPTNHIKPTKLLEWEESDLSDLWVIQEA